MRKIQYFFGAPASGSWAYQYVFTSPGLKPYYCSLHGGAGGVGMSAVINVVTATDIKEDELSPYDFQLKQNYPNPFNPSTKISWQSPVGSWQTLKIYDVLGNEVATLVDGYRPAGSYEVEFQSAVGGQQLASGIFFYKLSAGSFVETKKMILLR